ncbi:MAG: J domain-containing protein [Proteobacteria bacterium]|nr:J domain-containing protein [Pseudomonadota bacterium]
MSGDTDFILLYEELGLTPDRCSLDEFKRAYRRRVSNLHPDRRPNAVDEDSPEAMQRLTSLYGAAIAFERRFGRLPGAGPAPQRRHVTTPAGGYSTIHTAPGLGMRREFPSTPEPRSLRKRVILALLILLALAWALWGVGTITSQ